MTYNEDDLPTFASFCKQVGWVKQSELYSMQWPWRVWHGEAPVSNITCIWPRRIVGFLHQLQLLGLVLIGGTMYSHLFGSPNQMERESQCTEPKNEGSYLISSLSPQQDCCISGHQGLNWQGLVYTSLSNCRWSDASWIDIHSTCL